MTEQMFDVKIYFPGAMVSVKGKCDRAWVDHLQKSVRLGHFVTVTSSFDAEVQINPAFVTHIEATPINSPF